VSSQSNQVNRKRQRRRIISARVLALANANTRSDRAPRRLSGSAAQGGMFRIGWARKEREERLAIAGRASNSYLEVAARRLRSTGNGMRKPSSLKSSSEYESSLMFRKISIENFKSLADANVDLAPFTVLVGNNGAGKSSFLQAIELMSWAVRYASISDALAVHHIDFRDLVYLRFRESAIALGAEIDVNLADGNIEQVAVRMRFKKRRYVYIDHEYVRPFAQTSEADSPPYIVYCSSRKRIAVEQPAGRIVHQNVALGHSVLRDVYQARHGAEHFPVLFRVARHFVDYVHYEIWGPEQLRQPSNGERTLFAGPQDGRFLGKNGEGLPSLLWSIRANSSDRWAELLAELQSTYPAVREIRFKRGVEASELGLVFLEQGTSSTSSLTYRPAQMSDGFLRLLALLAIKYQLPPPLALLGYEEPENGLHPSALHDCMRHLKDIAKNGTQVIVTTHSPYLLNHLLEDESKPIAELRLVLRGKDGKTRMVPHDPEKIRLARRQGFGIGELWGTLLNEKELAQQ
jgi:predicted ATPase